MQTKPLHSFHANQTTRTCDLRIGGSRLAYSIPFHLLSTSMQMGIEQLVNEANADRLALKTLGNCVERMDHMADTYYSAPIWKRLWWAMCNDLPFAAKKD